MSLHCLAASWWLLQGKFHGDIRKRLKSLFQVFSLMDSYSLGCSGQIQLKECVFKYPQHCLNSARRIVQHEKTEMVIDSFISSTKYFGWSLQLKSQICTPYLVRLLSRPNSNSCLLGIYLWKLPFIAVRLQMIYCMLDCFRRSGLHDLSSSCIAKLNIGWENAMSIISNRRNFNVALISVFLFKFFFIWCLFMFRSLSNVSKRK